MPPGRVLVLGHQASYRCRHSGACCTAGWRIPVEPDRTATLRARFGGALEPDVPILRTAPDGTCVLFDPARDDRAAQCALHRACGHTALPSACRHFPRVYLHDTYATRVSLSHFCPTVASLLFTTSRLEIVEAPLDLARPDDREGLDAREAFPPLLHPGMLMDVESYAAWESGALDCLASNSGPAAAIARIVAGTERIRGWQPVVRASSNGGQGYRPATRGLLDSVRAAFREAREPRFHDEGMARVEPDLDFASTWVSHFDLARGTVPQGLTVPDLPEMLEETDAKFVSPVWHEFSPALNRYLAGRLFGSWVAYQGRGLRTVIASLACALSVVHIEAVRACLIAGRTLDPSLLTSAVREADLLLVHKADRQALAEALSLVEGRRTKEEGRIG